MSPKSLVEWCRGGPPPMRESCLDQLRSAARGGFDTHQIAQGKLHEVGQPLASSRGGLAY
jgi:hypothetical protein